MKNVLRPLYLLNADLGEPDVPDFALVLRALEKTELIVFGHCGIDPVQLVEIDPIETQTAKAAVKFLTQTFGTAVDRPFIRTGPVVTTFRRHHEMRGIRVQRVGD